MLLWDNEHSRASHVCLFLHRLVAVLLSPILFVPPCYCSSSWVLLGIGILLVSHALTSLSIALCSSFWRFWERLSPCLYPLFSPTCALTSLSLPLSLSLLLFFSLGACLDPWIFSSPNPVPHLSSLFSPSCSLNPFSIAVLLSVCFGKNGFPGLLYFSLSVFLCSGLFACLEIAVLVSVCFGAKPFFSATIPFRILFVYHLFPCLFPLLSQTCFRSICCCSMLFFSLSSFGTQSSPCFPSVSVLLPLLPPTCCLGSISLPIFFLGARTKGFFLLPICFPTWPTCLLVCSQLLSLLLFFSQAALARTSLDFHGLLYFSLSVFLCSGLLACLEIAVLVSVCFGTKPIVRSVKLPYPPSLPHVTLLDDFKVLKRGWNSQKESQT